MESSSIERAIALAIAGIAGAVAAFSVRLPDWLWSPNAPAWVQAVGAIVAIAATGLVANWQVRQEGRRRDLEASLIARDQAMLIAKSVHAWRDRARSWSAMLGDEDGMGDWVLISNLSDQPNWYAVPSEVMALVGNFRQLGGAGLALQRAVLAWQAVDAERATAQGLWAGGPGRIADDPFADRRIIASVDSYTSKVLLAALLVDGVLNG